MSKIKHSLGVFKLSNGKYEAEIGIKSLGEFDTAQEAATAYNKHVAKVFSCPTYNKNGEMDGWYTKTIVSEKEISEEKKIQILEEQILKGQEELGKDKITVPDYIEPLKFWEMPINEGSEN